MKIENILILFFCFTTLNVFSQSTNTVAAALHTCDCISKINTSDENAENKFLGCLGALAKTYPSADKNIVYEALMNECQTFQTFYITYLQDPVHVNNTLTDSAKCLIAVEGVFESLNKETPYLRIERKSNVDLLFYNKNDKSHSEKSTIKWVNKCEYLSTNNKGVQYKVEITNANEKGYSFRMNINGIIINDYLTKIRN